MAQPTLSRRSLAERYAADFPLSRKLHDQAPAAFPDGPTHALPHLDPSPCHPHPPPAHATGWRASPPPGAAGPAGAPAPPGTPAEVLGDPVILPPNNPDLVEHTLSNDPEIGCVILEPTGGHWGLVPVRGPFLRALRQV